MEKGKGERRKMNGCQKIEEKSHQGTEDQHAALPVGKEKWLRTGLPVPHLLQGEVSGRSW